MKRPRLRKWAKWTCTLAAGAAVGLAVFSKFYWWRTVHYWIDSGGAWYAFESGGLLKVGKVGSSFRTAAIVEPLWEMGPNGPWDWGLARNPRPVDAFLDWHAGVNFYRGPTQWYLGMSLLYPVALTLLPTALLWHADRRRLRPGSCGGCGYDRAGLTPTAPCPECGTVPTTQPPA